MTSSEPLPAARTLLDEPLQTAGAEHSYCLPPNTAGQAAQSQRRRPSAGPGARQLFPAALPAAATTDAVTSAAPQSTVVSVTDTDLPVATVSLTEVPVTLLPKTTYYRYKKKLEQGTTGVYKKHKAHYSCKKCGQPSTAETGHSQYRGFVFCPSQGKTKDAWLTEVKGHFLKKSS